jgi:hypothetical protein
VNEVHGEFCLLTEKNADRSDDAVRIFSVISVVNERHSQHRPEKQEEYSS